MTNWRDWFCCGCQRRHKISVWIEAETPDGYWCGRSATRARRERRNNAPPRYVNGKAVYTEEEST